MYVCRRFGVVRLFWTSPNREIVFVSFVRAGEAKLRVCVREIRFLSLAGKFQNFSSPPAPALLVLCCLWGRLELEEVALEARPFLRFFAFLL